MLPPGPPYPPPYPPPNPPPAPSARWWVVAPVALGVGALGVPVAALSLFLWFITVPVVVVALLTALGVCVAVGRTRPTAHAVAVGLLLAPVVSVLGLVLLLASGANL